jgi:CubicO group peptidase (beta-lactamase class C family)
MTGAPRGDWNWDVLAGAGALRSTAGDMLTFAAAALGTTDNPLKAAMQRMLSVTRPAGSPQIRQHLGWLEIGGQVLFHDGATGGFHSALALRPATKEAVIVLSNSTQDVTDVALHGVVPEQALLSLPAAKEHHEMQLPEEVLRTYAGTYGISANVAVVITQEGGRLFAQSNGEPRSELAAEAEGEFFEKTYGVTTFSFRKDASGAVTQLVIHLGVTDVSAWRRP